MLPRIIALCGNPKSGKSTAQKILFERFNYQVADDGRPLREIVHKYLGATWEQVSTQNGKKEKILINGREWEVRDALGQLGNVLEQIFGGDVICEMGLRANDMDFLLDNGGQMFQPMAPLKREGAPAHEEPCYSFGSVRREQGHFYRKHGGIVVEIHRTAAPPSEFEFDRYSKTAVQYTIVNDGDLDELERSIAALMRWVETGTPAPEGSYLHCEHGFLGEDGRGYYDRYGTVMRWVRPDDLAKRAE